MSRRLRLVGGLASLLIASGVLFLVAHERTNSYTVEGRVRGFGADSSEIFIEHTAIPDVMPAMTMKFRLQDVQMRQDLGVNDPVEFELWLGDGKGLITAIRKVHSGAVPRYPAGQADRFARTDTPTHLEIGDRVPSKITLQTQSGDQLNIGTFRNQTVVITFIYTRCPLSNRCPKISRKFAELQPLLRKQVGRQAHLLSVTFDPQYDRPDVLQAYAREYTDRLDTWTFATGSEEAISRLTQLFRVHTVDKEKEIVHNLVTAVIAPDGRLVETWRGTDWSVSEVARRVREISTGGPS